jgi:hypothetical protein
VGDGDRRRALATEFSGRTSFRFPASKLCVAFTRSVALHTPSVLDGCDVVLKKRLHKLHLSVAVLTGMRIGEDEEQPTGDSHQLGASSRARSPARAHEFDESRGSGLSDRKGTPLSDKNLYNRELAPACDRIGQPRISWHSFRHTHATLLYENGESLKTAQVLLGHSDLETTLNTFTHSVPDSQRLAVERVAGVLFSDVLSSEAAAVPRGRLN